MYDVVIIGGGPAGLSASVYAKRAGLKTLTIESSPLMGGQVSTTYDVDNYLGLKGMSGMDMANAFADHAKALECEIITATVEKVEKKDGGFAVHTDEGDFETHTVIAAMGAKHATLGVPGEAELYGMGVSYCATCDGAFFKGRTVAVVGGGDVAVEDAIYLARNCAKVYLVHRRDSLRAANSLQKSLMSLPNVEILWNTVINRINGEDEVTSITTSNNITGVKRDIPVDGVFVAVGTVPVNEILKGLVNLDEKGYVMSGEQCITGTPGIFVAGDLRTKKLRQIVTAVADGANAVNSVEQYLLKKRG